jgi:DNA-binding transcriptional ArsR family regulator
MLSFSKSDVSLLEKKASEAADMLKSISNKWRLLILCQLVKRELSVGELLEVIDLSQSALSQHLAVLRESDLVSTRRESQSIYYSLKGDEVSAILAVLYQIYCTPSGTSTKSGKGRGKR